MKLDFKGGKFAIEAWTDGSPVWSKITYTTNGTTATIVHGLHPSELQDLEYVVKRMRKAIEHQVGTRETA